MTYGYYFVIGKQDYFVVTKNTRKSKNLCCAVLDYLGHKPSKENLYTINKLMSKATCDIKKLSNGREYYDISGEYFGGCGTFIDDVNATKIIKI